jgi:nucleobase:cation symporter-1, NCS1 family
LSHGPVHTRQGRTSDWAGVGAQLIGTAAALACVNSTLLIGPVAAALDGADLSAFAGPVVAAATYATLTAARKPTAREHRDRGAAVPPATPREPVPAG